MIRFLCLLSIFVCGCVSEPESYVIDNGQMIIYQARDRGTDKLKYEYYVDNGEQTTWRLYTNEKFNVGDKVKISILSASEGTEP
jgi:hypothetical protein